MSFRPDVAPIGAPPSPLTDLAGIHVFIVEDDEDARIVLTSVLKYFGAFVTTASSAETALEDLGEYLPQVIICDLALPKADGFDFIRALRTLPQKRGGTLPVIAVSAFYEKFERPRALEVGFNDYLAKPLNFESLCRTIHRLAAL